MATSGSRLPARLASNVILRAAVFYAVLGGIAYFAAQYLPAWPRFASLPEGLSPSAFGEGAGAARLGAPPTAFTVVLAMVGAALLSLPVAWIYLLTRAKRGYQQSVVQTLIILPTVVAGIVVLVKESLPLAFGLAGIVAAVRFRTALDDSKDAVYVFLATGIGLSAAVDLPMAAALSIVFNIVVLLLWYTEFGRTPTQLDGRLAERKLKRAMEQLSRTGTFVARIDDEVFQGMTAEQLQAVADRAWRRARRHNPELPDTEGRRESLLRIRTTDPPGCRQALEPVLDEQLKRWRYGSVVHEPDGTHIVEYTVLLRKGVPPDELLQALRESGAPFVVEAELN